MEENSLEVPSEINNDPWDLAYVQPALRATPKARPEQPFPPAQLSKMESFFGSDIDQHGTVKLNQLGHIDRAAIDEYWQEQIQRAPKQNILSILIGEGCGSLRIGVTQKQTHKNQKANEATNELGEVEVIPERGFLV